MEVVQTEIPDVKMLKPVQHGDNRGFFLEIFKESVVREHGIDIHFILDGLCPLGSATGNSRCRCEPG